MNSAETRNPSLDVQSIRKDFPILDTQVGRHKLVYLDNAATTQKPHSVIDALTYYYSAQNANIHRGAHYLGEQATEAYDLARKAVAGFLNAQHPREIVFARGATEAINLVAATFGRQNLAAGDEILLTVMEHHANIVPWQLLAEQTGAVLKVIPMNERGELCLDRFKQLLGPRTKLLTFTYISNVLGTVNPVAQMIAQAHEMGVPVLIDGAQAVPHRRIDVQALDCDFFVFSGHKLFGPTGIGVLYGKEALLETMPPYQGGGDMIERVSFEKTTFRGLPEKFEAGTPHISGAVGLAAAVSYIQNIGWDAIEGHETDLLEYARTAFSKVEGLKLIGTAHEKVGVLSFTLDGVHPHDIGTILNTEGVAIRSGQHCAEPLIRSLGLVATARASLAFYNTREEIDQLVASLNKVYQLFR